MAEWIGEFRKFRKKPVVIEAIQMGPEHIGPEDNPQGFAPTGVKVWFDSFNGWGFFVDTLEGRMTGHIGDWLIIGIQGEKYFCKPDIFEATYEPAT